ncbi:MAG: protein kinase [Archangium sp.]|nr:protein kinase [Archangium sp.]
MSFIFKKPPDDGSTMTQPTPPGWKIVDLGLLGQGGMSRVYRVRDETLQREAALKVLRPELITEDDAVERFIDEAKITAQLDHPNIPPVYALAAEKKKSTCFTMKVLEGMSLQDMLKRAVAEGRNVLFPALEVLVRVCDAVAFAHSRGIVHCDLKPQNIMVGEHGQIYLVDWGLAKRLKDLDEADTSVHGTPAYMAPEQARGLNAQIDQRTDIFALGGILFRILTGRPPYLGQSADDTRTLAEQAKLTPPEQAAPPGTMLPRRLVTIAMRALSPEADQRYQTVAEFKGDVEDFIKGTARLPEKKFQAGEHIIREGDVGDCAYVILDGHCQASKKVAGKTQLLRLLGPGEMFGEAAVLTGSPRLASVVAMMETTVAVVDRSYLQEEMERTSLIALAIRAVATIFVDLDSQTTALLQEQSNVKSVEHALTELALYGKPGTGESKWVPWNATLMRITQRTGLTADVVKDRISRQPGLEIDARLDRLVLTPIPAR